jgi:hypothetical protein
MIPPAIEPIRAASNPQTKRNTKNLPELNSSIMNGVETNIPEANPKDEPLRIEYLWPVLWVAKSLIERLFKRKPPSKPGTIAMRNPNSAR